VRMRRRIPLACSFLVSSWDGGIGPN